MSPTVVATRKRGPEFLLDDPFDLPRLAKRGGRCSASAVAADLGLTFPLEFDPVTALQLIFPGADPQVRQRTWRRGVELSIWLVLSALLVVLVLWFDTLFFSPNQPRRTDLEQTNRAEDKRAILILCAAIVVRSLIADKLDCKLLISIYLTNINRSSVCPEF
jgi:hypothetical protein